MAKYKLTKESIEVYGRKLYRIQATASFSNVVKGDEGGFIEKEENLSQENNAWVAGNARVSGDAWVYGNAQVSGNAQVYGNARVYGKFEFKAGYYFGMRYGNEEIKEFEIEDGRKVLYKGGGKPEPIGETPQTLVGQEATVEIGGKKYKAKILEES